MRETRRSPQFRHSDISEALRNIGRLLGGLRGFSTRLKNLCCCFDEQFLRSCQCRGVGLLLARQAVETLTSHSLRKVEGRKPTCRNVSRCCCCWYSPVWISPAGAQTPGTSVGSLTCRMAPSVEPAVRSPCNRSRWKGRLGSISPLAFPVLRLRWRDEKMSRTWRHDSDDQSLSRAPTSAVISAKPRQ